MLTSAFLHIWQGHLDAEKQRRQHEGGGQMVPYGVPLAPPGAIGSQLHSHSLTAGSSAPAFSARARPGPWADPAPVRRRASCPDAAIPSWDGARHAANDECLAARSFYPNPNPTLHSAAPQGLSG